MIGQFQHTVHPYIASCVARIWFEQEEGMVEEWCVDGVITPEKEAERDLRSSFVATPDILIQTDRN